MDRRFNRPVAANGRDLNTILAAYDIEIMERALRYFMNAEMDASCTLRRIQAGGKNVEERNINAHDENYERAVTALHRLTGVNPIVRQPPKPSRAANPGKGDTDESKTSD